MKKFFSSIQNSVTTRRKVEKQGGQKIDINRLEHRLDFIQKKFSKRKIFVFDKETYFLLTQAKLKKFPESDFKFCDRKN